MIKGNLILIRQTNMQNSKPHHLFLCCLFILLGVFSCVTPTPTDLPSGSQEISIQGLRSHRIPSYILETEDSFTIKVVQEKHKAQVDKSVTNFQEDLTSGNVDEYYTNPSFTVLLSAGSEGSAFNTAEGIEQISKNGAVFAQAVVFNDNLDQAAVYKGQFSGGRFFFDNPSRSEISPTNTTYLIALDINLETRIFQGRLSAGSEGSALSAGSEGSALSAGSEGSAILQDQLEQELLAKNLQVYNKALEVYTEKNQEYQAEVKELTFVVKNLISLAHTETYARLMRAYRDEMRVELDAVRGLPKNLLYTAMKDGIDRVAQRWLEDCGSPVPDSGKLYPQLGPGFGSFIPVGFQSESLTQILEAEPAIKTYLKSENEKPREQRFEGRDFAQVLHDLEKEYPETFARFNWSDEFAPPDCVKPIKDKNPAPPPPAAGREGKPPPR